jgi:putative transposase
MTTTLRDHNAQPASDLVERNFSASGPDHLWVDDISYKSRPGRAFYLAFVLDAFSRRIVGCAMETHRRTELVLNAAGTAPARRRNSLFRPWLPG